MNATKGPLPPEMIAELQARQRELNDLVPEIDKAEYCGVDCQQMRAQRDASAMQIERLLETYASNPAQRLPQR